MLKMVNLLNGDNVMLDLTAEDFAELQQELDGFYIGIREFHTATGGIITGDEIVGLVALSEIGSQKVEFDNNRDGVEIRCPECSQMFTIYEGDIQLYMAGIEIVCGHCSNVDY